MRDVERTNGSLWKLFAVCWAAWCAGVAPASAREYFVAPGGSDESPGTLERPWKTIGKANAALTAGDTVFLRRGTYHERIEPKRSGKENAPITYRNFEKEEAKVVGIGDLGAQLVKVDYITLEGLDLDGQERIKGAVLIDDHADHITIRNCLLRNHRRASNTGGYGLKVGRKGTSHLLLEDCKIYRNGTTDPKREEGGNIRIDGAADHITIRGCDIYEANSEDGLHMGAFGGVVTDVLIENCRFWKCKEDGIDVKRVERVTVRNCDFWGHRKTETGGGAGINIHQSATDVLVDRCRSWDNMRGIGIAYNLPGAKWPPTQRITVQRCALYDNDTGLMVVGGLPRKPTLGKCKDIKVYNNVFYANREYGIELYAHKGGDLVGVQIKNNVFLKNKKVDFSTNRDRVKNVALDYNCYFGGRSAARDDRHALRVDPMFIDAEKRDFRLSAKSPLIDRGADVGLPFARSAPDLGAHEHGEREKKEEPEAAPSPTAQVKTSDRELAAAERLVNDAAASAFGRFRERIISGVAKGVREQVYVEIGGMTARAKIVSADAKGLVVNVHGGEVPMPWKTISPVRFAAIAEKYAGSGAAERVRLAALYAAAGRLEMAAEIVQALGAVEGSLKPLAESIVLLAGATR